MRPLLSALLTPLLLTTLAGISSAGLEVEPNNLLDQATQVSAEDPIQGSIGDSDDYYRVLLPQPASIQVVLEPVPTNADVGLVLYGFGPDPQQERVVCRSGGNPAIRCRLDATERSGYLKVVAAFGPKFCAEGWCGARLSADGPFITLSGESRAPTQFEGVPVVSPPEYVLHIQLPKTASGHSGERLPDLPSIDRRLPLFAPETWPCRLQYPKGWSFLWQREDRHVLFLPGDAGGEIRLDLERRERRDYPGSSPAKQLNLAERDIEAIGGVIRQRDRMQVAGQTAPYLVAVIPAPDKTGSMSLFGHLQLVFEFQDEYLWFSYRAPVAEYGRHLAGIQTILDSLQEKDIFAPPKDDAAPDKAQSPPAGKP